MIQAGARLQIERALINSPMPAPYRDVTELIVTGWLEHQAVAIRGLPEDLAVDELARVLVAAVFGAQHISWVLTDRADIVDRVPEIIRVAIPAGAADADQPRLGTPSKTNQAGSPGLTPGGFLFTSP